MTAHRESSHKSYRLDSGFIWFVAQDWWYHNQAHSDFQLMKEVSRLAPVLVVNSLGMRLPGQATSTNPRRRIWRKIKSMTKLLRRPLKELPNFHVYTPLMFPIYGSNGLLARLNAALIRIQVRIVARLAGLNRGAAIGVTIPTAWPVVAPMRRSSLVFNRADLHSAFPEADGAWVEGLERMLLQHSDHVLYVSHELMQRDEDVVGERAFFIDHGVDLEHFQREGSVHPELADIPRPRIGFFGGLDDYVVDMALLEETARSLPEASLVLVGDATCSMAALTELPNVHWFGFRNYDEIPAFGRGFDVGLMPWLDNEWIQHANPIKLKEYLSLGLPVVTTKYPEVEPYREQVRVARREDFATEVAAAYEDPGDAEERVRFVRQYSWTGRAEALLNLIGND